MDDLTRRLQADRDMAKRSAADEQAARQAEIKREIARLRRHLPEVRARCGDRARLVTIMIPGKQRKWRKDVPIRYEEHAAWVVATSSSDRAGALYCLLAEDGRFVHGAQFFSVADPADLVIDSYGGAKLFAEMSKNIALLLGPDPGT